MSEDLTKEEEKKYDDFNKELLDYMSDNFLDEYVAFYLFLSNKYDVIGNTSLDTMMHTALCEACNIDSLNPNKDVVLHILVDNYHLKLIDETHTKFEEL